jgi:hypothetical protein
MSQTATNINNTTRKLNNTIKQREIYDPRILNVDDTSKALWNTESVNLAIQGLSAGYKLRENPFLKSVQGGLLRKASLPFKYTEDEIKIISICAEDKLFFSNNFGKLKDGANGWAKITLRDYQEKLLKKYTLNKWNIVMFPRQSGKTTTTVLDIVHFLLFNIDKDCVCIAQSDTVVKEILAKIKECFIGLPFFLQPGFVSFNKKGCILDNGCRLSIGIASESVVQGFALDYLFIDEFAYIKQSMVRKFWNNIYPTLINNPDSKCIIASTPNGRNLFWELWKNAELKLNRFITSRIYWYDVPGRNDQFKLDTIANVGIEGWEMGFECSFDTGLKSIFNTNIQKLLRSKQLEGEFLWSKNNNYLGEIFNMEFISQDYIKYDFKNDYFTLSLDISEGLEQDSTVAKLKKIEWDKKLQKLIYTSVGIMRDNTIAVEDLAEWVIKFVKNFNSNKIKIIVENNTYGGEFFNQINALKMYDSEFKNFNNDIFAKFMRESKNDFEFGIRWNIKNKKLAVKSFSNLITSDIIRENHYLSIEEYLNFGRCKNGTYSAQYGHDDTVMTDVTLSHFIKANNIFTNNFLLQVENDLRTLCNDESIDVIQRKEAEKRKANNVFKHNGFEIRDSSKYIEADNNDDIFVFNF